MVQCATARTSARCPTSCFRNVSEPNRQSRMAWYVWMRLRWVSLARRLPFVEARVETPGRGFRGAKASDAGSRAAHVSGRDSKANTLTRAGSWGGAWRPFLKRDQTAGVCWRRRARCPIGAMMRRSNSRMLAGMKRRRRFVWRALAQCWMSAKAGRDATGGAQAGLPCQDGVGTTHAHLAFITVRVGMVFQGTRRGFRQDGITRGSR